MIIFVETIIIYFTKPIYVEEMNKQDHIDYWRRTADSDWTAAETLFDKGHYLQCLFFAHLVLEKLLKAHWVKDNTTLTPPKVHNLEFLMLQTDLQFQLTVDEKLILDSMGLFQMQTRYPDYQFKINKLCTLSYTQTLLDSVRLLKNSLLSKLP